MARPSMLSLAGGLPHPENFPFEGLEVRLGGDGEVRIGKGGGGGAVAGDEGSIDLAVAMQYGEKRAPGGGQEPSWRRGTPLLRDPLFYP